MFKVKRLAAKNTTRPACIQMPIVMSALGEEGVAHPPQPSPMFKVNRLDVKNIICTSMYTDRRVGHPIMTFANGRGGGCAASTVSEMLVFAVYPDMQAREIP